MQNYKYISDDHRISSIYRKHVSVHSDTASKDDIEQHIGGGKLIVFTYGVIISENKLQYKKYSSKESLSILESFLRIVDSKPKTIDYSSQ